MGWEYINCNIRAILGARNGNEMKGKTSSAHILNL